MASYVQRTRFAIGYVEYIYSRKHLLSDVALRNHNGRFVQAGRDSFRAAAETADWHWRRRASNNCPPTCPAMRAGR